ncbi:hypothetical protein NKH77_46095 [Streptomyces sp. M19]
MAARLLPGPERRRGDGTPGRRMAGAAAAGRLDSALVTTAPPTNGTTPVTSTAPAHRMKR